MISAGDPEGTPRDPRAIGRPGGGGQEGGGVRASLCPSGCGDMTQRESLAARGLQPDVTLMQMTSDFPSSRLLHRRQAAARRARLSGSEQGCFLAAGKEGSERSRGTTTRYVRPLLEEGEAAAVTPVVQSGCSLKWTHN